MHFSRTAFLMAAAAMAAIASPFAASERMAMEARGVLPARKPVRKELKTPSLNRSRHWEPVSGNSFAEGYRNARAISPVPQMAVR